MGKQRRFLGDLFAIGTILAPPNKFRLLPELRDQYRKSFETYAGLYKERLQLHRARYRYHV
jgi:hypothetical protein